MTNPDVLMSAIINCNNNYRDKTPTSPSSNIEKPQLKNVTPPKKKFTQLEFNFEEGVNE